MHVCTYISTISTYTPKPHQNKIPLHALRSWKASEPHEPRTKRDKSLKISSKKPLFLRARIWCRDLCTGGPPPLRWGPFGLRLAFPGPAPRVPVIPVVPGVAVPVPATARGPVLQVTAGQGITGFGIKTASLRQTSCW